MTKNRVLVDSGAEKGPSREWKLQRVVRMIGPGFFQDMIGGKRDKNRKTKIILSYCIYHGGFSRWVLGN